MTSAWHSDSNSGGGLGSRLLARLEEQMMDEMSIKRIEELGAEKKSFVEFSLAPFLYMATSGQVVGCGYLNDSKERGYENESVIVDYSNGYSKWVNVTGDSFIGITHDVLREIG